MAYYSTVLFIASNGGRSFDKAIFRPFRSSALSNDQKFWTLEAILSDDRCQIDIRCDIIASSLLSVRQKSRFIDSTSSKTTDNVVSPSKPCMSIRCPCPCSCHVMSCHVHVHVHVHASSLRIKVLDVSSLYRFKIYDLKSICRFIASEF